ncbi:ABATE domain-containing protein, partial [Streptomyces sp. NPDC001940]
MVTDRDQQDVLLELLNSTPVANGVVQDQLADPQEARSWQQAHGGNGSANELRSLVQARDALQNVVRGSRPATSLAPLLKGVTSRPEFSPEGAGALGGVAPWGYLALLLAVACVACDRYFGLTS